MTEGSGHGLYESIIAAHAWRDWEKTQNLSQGQDLNLELPNYEASVLTTYPWLLVKKFILYTSKFGILLYHNKLSL
jgi:hypothetical protein